MASKNGVFVKWALTILALGALSLAGWSGKTLVSHGERITRVEAVHEEFRDQLRTINWKLDRLIERGR